MQRIAIWRTESSESRPIALRTRRNRRQVRSATCKLKRKPLARFGELRREGPTRTRCANGLPIEAVRKEYRLPQSRSASQPTTCWRNMREQTAQNRRRWNPPHEQGSTSRWFANMSCGRSHPFQKVGRSRFQQPARDPCPNHVPLTSTSQASTSCSHAYSMTQPARGNPHSSASAGRKHHTQPKPTTKRKAAEPPPAPSMCFCNACFCTT